MSQSRGDHPDLITGLQETPLILLNLLKWCFKSLFKQGQWFSRLLAHLIPINPNLGGIMRINIVSIILSRDMIHESA